MMRLRIHSAAALRTSTRITPSASALPTTSASWPKWRRRHGGTGVWFCSAVPRAGRPSRCWRHNSYRWWADILDHDLTADVLSVRAPILIVPGERDRSAPVEVARMARDDFQRAGRCNLTYWELPGYDHQMQDPAGVSHIDEVMQRISGWLAKVGTNQSEG